MENEIKEGLSSQLQTQETPPLKKSWHVPQLTEISVLEETFS